MNIFGDKQRYRRMCEFSRDQDADGNNQQL